MTAEDAAGWAWFDLMPPLPWAKSVPATDGCGCDVVGDVPTGGKPIGSHFSIYDDWRVDLDDPQGFAYALRWYCQHTTSAQRDTIPDWGAIHHRHLYGKTTDTDRLQLARECARVQETP